MVWTTLSYRAGVRSRCASGRQYHGPIDPSSRPWSTVASGSFATSLTTTFWNRREALHQSRLVESLSAYDPNYVSALAQLHAHGFGGDSAPAMVLQQVIGQGYLLSSLDLFYFSGWMVMLLVPLCWLVRRPAQGAAAVGAE